MERSPITDSGSHIGYSHHIVSAPPVRFNTNSSVRSLSGSYTETIMTATCKRTMGCIVCEVYFNNTLAWGEKVHNSHAEKYLWPQPWWSSTIDVDCVVEVLTLSCPCGRKLFREYAPLVISLDISHHRIFTQYAPQLLHEYSRYDSGPRHLIHIQTKTFSYAEWALSAEFNLGPVTYPEQYPLFISLLVEVSALRS